MRASTAVLASVAAVASVAAAHFYHRKNQFRLSFAMEVTDEVGDKLDYAEREFFQRYERVETRRRLHEAFSYLYYDYLADLPRLSRDLSYVIRVVLGRDLADDPEGALAYHELREVLQDLMEYVDGLTPEPDLLDILSGGIWGERLEPPHVPEPPDGVGYDDRTSEVVMRQFFPERNPVR